MKKKNYIFLMISAISIAFILFTSCESELPNDYIPQVFVEGYLIVDSPIENIIVQISQSPLDSFKYEQSLIDDAEVFVIEGENKYKLSFRSEGTNKYGYYYQDTTLLVKPETRYNLEITLNDGTFITGNTVTPKKFNWIEPVKEKIYYPKDTINLPENDSLKFSWEDNSQLPWFFVRVRNLDTLGYGQYLTPPTMEQNRRIYKRFGRGSRYYNDVALWIGPLPNNNTPLVWSVLKWYGINEVAIFSPDYNFLRWFLHVQRSGQYQPLLSSLEGAMGTFGSAAAIYDTTFIIKNQP